MSNAIPMGSKLFCGRNPIRGKLFWPLFLAVFIGASLFIAMLAGAASAESMPRNALKYRAEMIRSVRYVWGMSGPVAVMSAQVHQESAWDATAQSRFAGGLGQFTPDTAAWIAEAYPKELSEAQPFNPSWAIRALIRYDFHLYSRQEAASPCDAWAMSLAAYNGGPGWIARDRKLTEAAGGDPLRWFGNVERHSDRAAWAFEENRQYPRRILLTLQPLYRGWGPGVDCARAGA